MNRLEKICRRSILSIHADDIQSIPDTWKDQIPYRVESRMFRYSTAEMRCPNKLPVSSSFIVSSVNYLLTCLADPMFLPIVGCGVQRPDGTKAPSLLLGSKARILSFKFQLCLLPLRRQSCQSVSVVWDWFLKCPVDDGLQFQFCLLVILKC